MKNRTYISTENMEPNLQKTGFDGNLKILITGSIGHPEEN